MTDERVRTAKQLFLEALELPRAEHAAFLARECAGDAELQRDVAELLEAAASSSVRLFDADRARTPPGDGVGTSIGDYKLLQVIGEGGFGTVYMAEQQRPVVRKVALKVLKLGMDTRAVVARFEAERQALALMDHPCIARVLDAGATDTGRPYFVMELVHGVPITQFCDDAKLDIRARVELFRDVCLALQHAHQKGVIHRDIKPSNVLVTMLDDRPLPKVIDFGIAKATHQRLTDKTLFTQFGQFLGTPAYMSPEQAQFSALDVDTRSDVYALGVLLYELLTGSTPFDARVLLEAGFQEIRRVIREVEPPRPSTRISTLGDLKSVAAQRATDAGRLGPSVRGDLDWVTMKCLEKDRTRRYDSAGALASDLERYLGELPVEATPPSAMYRLRKLARRHRTLVFGAAAVLVALVAGLTVAILAWITAGEERDAKESALLAAQRAGEESRVSALAAAAASERANAAARELEQQLRMQRKRLYARSIGAADTAFDAGEFDRARALLESAPEEERGFEWQHLRARLEPVERFDVAATLAASDGSRAPAHTRFAWSAGGARLAALEAQGRITVRELASGRTFPPLVTLPPEELEGAPRRITTSGRVLAPALAAFAFSPDGRSVATCGGVTRSLRVWDVESGTLRTTLAAGEDWDELAFDPAGEFLAARARDADGRWVAPSLWTLDDGRRRDLVYPDGGVLASSQACGTLAFTDAALVACGPEVALVAWSLADPVQPRELWRAAARVRVLAARAGTVYAGCADATVALDVASARVLAKLPSCSESGALVPSPDGRRVALTTQLSQLVSGSPARRLVLADAFSGAELRRIPTQVRIAAVAFRPGGRELLVVGADAFAHDVALDDALFTLRAPWFEDGGGLSLPIPAYTRDGRRLVTTSDVGAASSHAVRVFDADDGRVLLRFAGEAIACAHPDGQRIAVAHRARDGSPPRLALHAFDGGAELGVVPGIVEEISALAFDATGRRLAVATWERDDPARNGQVYRSLVRVVDVATGAVACSVESHRSLVDVLDFSPDGRRLLTKGTDSKACFVDAASGDVITEYDAHPGSGHWAAFREGERVFVAVTGAQLRVLDVDTGARVRTIELRDAAASACAFLDGARRVALAGLRGVTIVDLDTEEEIVLFERPGEYDGVPLSLAARPDGRQLAASTLDGRIRVLETSAPDAALRARREAAFVAQRAEELVAALRREALTDADRVTRLETLHGERTDVVRAALELLGSQR